MTKQIRIENADLSNWKVKVLVQDKKYVDGKPTDEWITVKESDLNMPTQLIQEYITGTRRIIVLENGSQ